MLRPVNQPATDDKNVAVAVTIGPSSSIHGVANAANATVDDGELDVTRRLLAIWAGVMVK